jgi:DNA-binding beta-propeller fold protein YncE
MRSRRRIFDVVGVLLLVAAAAVAVFLVTREDDDGGGGDRGGQSAAQGPDADPKVDRIELGGKAAPRHMAIDDAGVYYLDAFNNQAVRVDKRSRKVSFRTKIPGLGEIAVDGQRKRAWVTNVDNKTVTEIDTSNGKVVGKPFDVQREPNHIGVTDNEVIILSSGSANGRLLRVSKDTQRDVGRPRAIGATTDFAVGGPGLVVIGGVFSPEFITYTPELEEKSHFTPKIDGIPTEIVPDGNVVWVTLLRTGAFDTPKDGAVIRMDLTTGRLIGKEIKVDQDPSGLAIDGDSAWVVSQKEGTLTRIDKRTGRIVGKPIFLGERIIFGDVAARNGEVWVSGANELFHYKP